ncbi:MAG: ATPase, T2SS/T4P/T4SS family [Acidimicrobiales bacterium]
MADDAEQGARRRAEQHGLRFVDLTQSALAPGAASLLPESIARRHNAVPIGRRLGTPVIAVADPGDLFAMDALRASVGREFVAVVARPEQVDRAIRQLYTPGEVESDDVVSSETHDGSHPGAEAAAARVDSPSSTVAIEDPPPSRGPGGVEVADAEVEPDPLSDPAARGSHDLEETTGHYAEFTIADGGFATDEAAAANGDVKNGDDIAGFAVEPTTDHATNGNGHDPGSGSGAAGSTGAGTLEESLREVLSPPDTGSHYVAPLTGAPVDADGWGVPSDEGSSTDAPAEARPGAGQDTDLGAIPPPPPEFTTVDGGLALPPAAPAGYGLIDSPEAPAPVFYGPPLARVLVESGRVSPEDIAVALQAHQQTGESLARYLYNQQLASEDDLVWAMAQEVGLEFVDLDKVTIEPGAVSLIPEAVARHHMVLPIAVDNGVPVVALANPTDVFAMDDLRQIMGRNFTPVVATRSQIASHLRFFQDHDVNVADVAEDAALGQVSDSGFELESLHAVVEDAPIVRYVNLLILQALNERASDIHIEPTPKRLRIRFRIDGVMHDATSASAAIQNAVVSRLKVLGEMDITEHRIPQEGRVSLQVSDRQIDLRLATLPSIYGETVVMRLLDKSASIRTLPQLGFLPDTLERYAESYHHPYGVILVTGPTGAGKTTTLYATLKEVTSPEKSVVTVEDPVEYQIDGITQVQINRKAGLAFSTALRSILRADPDIVLIGEIRDTDTATIAMEAALSGHLVLTTLHTNTASATPLRLTEMGIEPFLVTSAVGSVLTQRLARVLCEQCKEPYDASEKDFLAAGYKEADLEGVDVSTLYRAIGCRACSHTGYLGREVLAEVMNMTEEIDRMIIEQETIVNIERQAIEQGMRTLRLDGLVKAVEGRTTLEEVLRVVV